MSKFCTHSFKCVHLLIIIKFINFKYAKSLTIPDTETLNRHFPVNRHNNS